MQDNLKPYPQYKESGTTWLGQVPYNWNITRLGAMFIERKEKVSDKDFSPLSVTKNGILPQLVTAAKTNDGDNRKKVCQGDFVINSRSDRKGSSGLSSLTGSVSVISTVLQPNGYNNKYSHYLLKSQPFQEEFYRVGQGIVADLWSTKYSEMRSILTPIPDMEEQHQIAGFLDWKTSQISKFIKAKRRLIELLKEQKQVIINDTVTGKIDVRTGKPYPKYKDSGVEWLGMVPEEWEVKRLKYIGQAIIGLTYSPSELADSTGVLVLRSCNIKNGKIINDNNVYVNKIIPSNLTVIHNDILICSRSGSRKLVGKSALISEDFIGVTFGVFMSIFRSLINDFIYLVFNSRIFNYVAADFSTSTINQLTLNDLNELPIPLPPRPEQIDIINYINEKTKTLYDYILSTEKEISLIQEYRTCLIADVVTGKVDVRDIVVPVNEIDTNDVIDASVEEEFVDETEEQSVNE